MISCFEMCIELVFASIKWYLCGSLKIHVWHLFLAWLVLIIFYSVGYICLYIDLNFFLYKEECSPRFQKWLILVISGWYTGQSFIYQRWFFWHPIGRSLSFYVLSSYLLLLRHVFMRGLGSRLLIQAMSSEKNVANFVANTAELLKPVDVV